MIHRCRVSRNEDIVVQEIAQITRETGHEMGVPICYNPQTKDWSAGELCVGTECDLFQGNDECPLDYEPAYYIHTHPGDTFLAPSYQDIADAMRHKEKQECIVSPEIDKMMCIDIANMRKEGFRLKGLSAFYDVVEEKMLIEERDCCKGMKRREKEAYLDEAQRKMLAKMLPWYLGEHNYCIHDIGGQHGRHR